MTLAGSFFEYFSDIKDPRVQNHNFRHKIIDILVIAVLATICGADGWAEIERFGKSKQDWLGTFLELPNGIPSHDTFGRVFSILDPKEFGKCFSAWLKSLTVDFKNEIIALDGKTVRGSGNKRQKEPAIHLVSAWAAKTRIMLAQVKTEDKSNEITAMPKLLDMLDIKGSVITIDAMGCQTEIAKKIKKKEADYLLCLKENQKTLYDDVKSIFERAEENKQKQYKKVLHRRKIEKTHNHGRVETGRYTLVSARAPLFFELRWPGLRGIGKIEITRTTNNEVEYSTRYFLTSLHYEDIEFFMEAVRKHWQIEIDLHWSLDVSFREDHCQVRLGHAPENLALIRRIALNLLKQEQTHKNGISCRRKTAGWDNKYLLKVLTADRQLTKVVQLKNRG
jgi:predicted transposase YbfD/YdcC